MDKKKSNKTDVKDYANERARTEVLSLSFILESLEQLLKLLMPRPLPDQLNQNLCGCNQNQCFRVFPEYASLQPGLGTTDLECNFYESREFISSSQVCPQHPAQNLAHGMCIA